MDRTVSTAFPRLAAAPVMVLSAVLTLGACQMSQTEAAMAEPGVVATDTGPGGRVIERDVEAPEVFQASENGLWDGRPSLGGVWVAHPTAHDPERVLIRNRATGATVIGALFRRERENPGPRFQVSSEAANALGILAGAPTEIEVTALRLQRVEMEIDPAPEEVATAATETLAIAPVATAESPTAQPAGQVAVADVEAEEPRRGLLGLFRRRTPEPETTAIAETALAPAAGAATAAATATAEAGVAPVAVVEAEPQRRSFRDLFRRRERTPEPDTTLIALPDANDAPTSAAASAPLQATGTAPLPPQAAQPAGPRIDRPFVQIGIFSVEQNAVNARNAMQQAGLAAEVRRGRVGENLYWRVVVGPASSTAQRGEFLRRVRELGFADAYAVVR
ncbi:SPOR domain-containing protein [Pararhodobacter sp. CCB-MM2]|uniref:SPOR domain-containing protein n=1 Tax=Pararhodobacter sp. CCB-MM2 TaxID=1786003 RepID=UPI000B23A6F5|nr:SPOR domain-containing protein [Pararhodobacter sp. CCB-MM2]